MSMTESSVTLQAKELVGGGRALGHHEGETWMIAGALPDEIVAAEPVRRRAAVVEARLVEVISNPHPARCEPCPHDPSCGGCDWSHVGAAEGAALKARVAAGAARGLPALASRLANAPVRPSPLAYRLRARLHWDPASGCLGFYRPRSWEAVPITGCRIISPRLQQALPSLAQALTRRCPERLDLEWLEDLSGKVAAIALTPARAGPRKIDPAWLPGRDEIAEVVAGCHALSPTGGLGRGWGEHALSMAPGRLEVPVGAFFQVNRHLVDWLFGRISELVGPDPVPTWDLHAGVGFLAAAALAASQRDLVLVEPVARAGRAAARNLPTARVVRRTAEAYLAQHRRLPARALVITDPPRAGMAPALRSRLAGWHPARIVMLACDPATWARDTAALLELGYHLVHLELVDLFPSTHHVEIVAVLESG